VSALCVRQFHKAVHQMPLLLQGLRAAPSHRVGDHPNIPARPGIYLFSERQDPIYVGESRNLLLANGSPAVIGAYRRQSARKTGATRTADGR
jgi:hypothetical protein